MEVRIVTVFEFGMEIAFLPLHAFSPFTAFGFLYPWADRELEKEGFLKAYCQLIGIPELDPLLALIPTSPGLASSHILSPILQLGV